MGSKSGMRESDYTTNLKMYKNNENLLTSRAHSFCDGSSFNNQRYPQKFCKLNIKYIEHFRENKNNDDRW